MKTGKLFGLAGAALLACVGMAEADYPDRPITLIVGYAPGGGTDTVGRVLAHALSDVLGQPVNVDNVPGAAGGVAATTLASRPADGYTLLFAPGATITTNPMMNEALSYEMADFVGISSIADFQPAFVASTSAPYDTLPEFFAWARENGPVPYATLTPTSRVLMELLSAREGFEVNYIPLRGGGDMVTGLMGNQYGIAYSGGIHQSHRDAIKVLASASSRRLVLDPEASTLPELGYDLASVSSFVVFAPAALDSAILETLETAIATAFDNEDLQRVLTNTGFPPRLVGSEETATELQEQHRVSQIVNESMQSQ